MTNELDAKEEKIIDQDFDDKSGISDNDLFDQTVNDDDDNESILAIRVS